MFDIFSAEPSPILASPSPLPLLHDDQISIASENPIKEDVQSNSSHHTPILLPSQQSRHSIPTNVPLPSRSTATIPRSASVLGDSHVEPRGSVTTPLNIVDIEGPIERRSRSGSLPSSESTHTLNQSVRSGVQRTGR